MENYLLFDTNGDGKHYHTLKLEVDKYAQSNSEDYLILVNSYTLIIKMAGMFTL